MILNYNIKNKEFNLIESAIAIIFCFLPIFLTFPYKINLYLAWEGAYRLYIGQFPFQDYGMPLGYAFWLIPGLFFKFFGPYMSTLIKAQVFINLLSVVAFSSILRTFKVAASIRVLGVFLFCLSYVFINFWPWYNHSVFVYELIGLAFLIRGIVVRDKFSYLWITLGGFFIFISIFTKQDIGGLGLLLALALLFINNYIDREFRTTLIFGLSVILTGCLFIIPLLPYDFNYWFNYGQAPHSSRIIPLDYLDEIFNTSSLLPRLYLIILLIIGISKITKAGFHNFFKQKEEVLFLFFSLGIVVQALLAQVTTYIPANAHYYYHSFVLVFLLSQVKSYRGVKVWQFSTLLILVIFLWSHDYWRYGKRIVQRTFGFEQKLDYNVVNKRTWIIREEGADTDRSDWKKAPFRSLDNVYLPEETIAGMQRIINTWQGKKNLKVLNMSELTQLAYELGYSPLSGEDYPLWFHRNVAFFEREEKKFCENIENQTYDLVLFEDIPLLNRFYPPAVRQCLQEHYRLADRFLAPRIPEHAYIEVYVRREGN